jgi:hypothetical protein
MTKRKFCLVSAFLLLVYGFQEILFRISFPLPEVLNFNRINYTNVLLLESESPPYQCNTSFVWESKPDGAMSLHHLNLYGFRDRDWKLRPNRGTPRIMFVGDSFVEGFLAGDTETIPDGFAKESRAKGFPQETLNLGIGASGLPEYCRLTRDAVPLLSPYCLVLVLYANDFPLQVFDPGWIFPPLHPEQNSSYRPHLLSLLEFHKSRHTVPRAWHSPPYPFVPPVPDSRNPWSNEEFSTIAQLHVTPNLAKEMKQGRFNPYAFDTYGVMERMLKIPADATPYLDAINSYTEKHHCELYVVYLPSCHQVSDAYLPFHSEYSIQKHPKSLQGDAYQTHARELGQACAKLNIPYLNLTPIIKDHEKNNERLYWDYDEHMRGKGYLLIGKYIYNWIFTKNNQTSLLSRID